MDNNEQDLMTCFVCGGVVPESSMTHGVHLKDWDDMESICSKQSCQDRVDKSR